jgi:hypothetical protein
MKTLTVEMPDEEYVKLGIKSPAIAYNELMRKVKQQELMELLDRANRTAKKYGLADMSDEELNSIINEVRLEMKNDASNT